MGFNNEISNCIVKTQEAKNTKKNPKNREFQSTVFRTKTKFSAFQNKMGVGERGKMETPFFIHYVHPFFKFYNYNHFVLFVAIVFFLL